MVAEKTELPGQSSLPQLQPAAGDSIDHPHALFGVVDRAVAVAVVSAVQHELVQAAQSRLQLGAKGITPGARSYLYIHLA